MRRFMLVFGSLSSLFDLGTFALLVWLFRASAATFQTAWFVESLTSQALVIFVIRTHTSARRSRPHPVLAALSLGAVALAVILPYSRLGKLIGFVPLQPLLLASLARVVVGYLLVTEIVKRAFFRYAEREA